MAMAAGAMLGRAIDLRLRGRSVKFFLQSMSVLLIVYCSPQGESKIHVFID